MSQRISTHQLGEAAILEIGAKSYQFQGRWIFGNTWDRFGHYDTYILVHSNGVINEIAAHSGELVPGSTEDLVAYFREQWPDIAQPRVPLTIEIDPTNACLSHNCGNRCFSAAYRKLNPTAQIGGSQIADILTVFAKEGGKIVRFDGGGDPLLHEDIHCGRLLLFAKQLALSTTVLTSGETLASANLSAIADSGCYLRVSINASTDKTRREFHGNTYSAKPIFDAIARFSAELSRKTCIVPIGATFLLDIINYHEVYDCAKICRDLGVQHFSVRRVLGPQALRPAFSARQCEEIYELLKQVSELSTPSFRVFVPWRPIDEPDLAPSHGAINASRCWQSTFKAILEPADNGQLFRVQLCGRYRGCGLGQILQQPPLFQATDPNRWTHQWRDSFTTFPRTREELIRYCPSCIDRGFIQMIDGIAHAAVKDGPDFTVLHMKKKEAPMNSPLMIQP